jgi:ubiquinol-cytochrome c reductase iron-sulfur subunit
LEDKGKAAVLLTRLDPADIKVKQERDWGHDGIVAYSKICTHVGCPVGLYEQQTHHLLCPCHQSTFDVTQDCKVIFGPAHRPLPQLKITVDSEGYLVADAPFREAVGPSFFERGSA